MFVHGNDLRIAFALRNLNGNDLVPEAPRLPCRLSAALGLHGVGVLLFAADGVTLGQPLGGASHEVAAQRAQKAVPVLPVDHLVVAHPVAPPCAGEEVGRVAHALHTAGEHDFGTPLGDRLCREDNRLQSRGARLVDRKGRR